MDSSIPHRTTRSKASDRTMPATPSPTKSDASEQVQQLAPVASLNSSTPHCEDPMLPGLGALHREWLEPPSKCPGQNPSGPTLPIRQLQHEAPANGYSKRSKEATIAWQRLHSPWLQQLPIGSLGPPSVILAREATSGHALLGTKIMFPPRRNLHLAPPKRSPPTRPASE